MNILQTEPAVVIAGIGAVAEAALLVLIAFGVPITPDEKLALTGFGTVVITVATGIVTRSQVTPVATAATATSPSPSPATPIPPIGG